ncbi:hypothetical protein SAMN02927895_04906 [Belnapia rosea]|nr:hypothetical protein SAMN02927895_04906 [Belnapia rosea]
MAVADTPAQGGTPLRRLGLDPAMHQGDQPYVDGSGTPTARPGGSCRWIRAGHNTVTHLALNAVRIEPVVPM